MRRSIDELTGGAVAVDPGGLYRLLRQLEQEGVVESTWSEGGFGPQRRDYSLTGLGWELLASWREDLAVRDRVFRSVIAEIDKVLGPQNRDGGGETSARSDDDPDSGKPVR